MASLNVNTALKSAAIIGAGYFAYKTFNKLGEGAETLGAAAGSALAEMQQFFNGSHKTEATAAGIVLQAKYISADGTVNPTWKNAIVQAHPDNHKIMSRILTQDGKLKHEYWDYIGREITLEVVQ